MLKTMWGIESDVEEILSRTCRLWDEIRGDSIFITGGTGFFGNWLLKTFSAANVRFDLNARAVVLSRNPENFLRDCPSLAGVSFHRGDVRDFEFPDGKFSHIIHAATPVSASLNDQQPFEMFDIVANGTRRVLEFAARCCATRILLCSSGAVYGRQPPDLLRVPETFGGGPDPLDPKSAYAQGKRIAEWMCTTCSGQTGIEMKIARCFAFIGPYLPLGVHLAAGNFLRDALDRRPILVQGDGTPYRSYLYAADLMIWLWTILFRGVSCRAYNVGSETAIDIADLAKCIAATVAPGTPVEIRTPPATGRTPERYVPSTERARSELQLAEYTPLTEAIQRTADWHQLRRSV